MKIKRVPSKSTNKSFTVTKKVVGKNVSTP